MNHFIARLVERARGTAPRVEPIVASRFAPAAIVEVVSEAEAIPAPRTEQQPQGKERLSRGEVLRKGVPNHKVEARTIREAEKSPPLPETAVMEPEPEKLLLPTAVVAAASTAFVRPSQSTNQSMRLVNGGARKESFAFSSATRSTSATPTSATAPRFERRRATPDASRQEPPIVRVTIGRIDVRATPPPAPTLSSPRRSEPKLTLDAYLKSRREGTR